MTTLELIKKLEHTSFSHSYRILDREGWDFRDGDHSEGYLVMGKGLERLRVVRERFFGTEVTYGKAVL
jgi:hypothetical protein